MVCQAELRELGKEAEQRGLRSPVIVAVGAERAEDLVELQQDLGPAVRLLGDPGLTAAAAYGLLHPHGGLGASDTARPATFVIGRDGRLAYAHAAVSVLDRPDAAASLDQWASVNSAPGNQ